MRREALARLEDIRVEAQFQVDDATGETWESYLQNGRFRRSVERSLSIIGEEMAQLRRQDLETAQRITAYTEIIGLRNVLVYGYNVVDYATVRNALLSSLPILKTEVEQLLREGNEDAATPAQQ